MNYWRDIEERGGRHDGIVEYTPEFSRTVRRRFQQHKLSKQPLPEEEPLPAVRKLRSRTQREVGCKLLCSQHQISELERRKDMRVSSLRRFVEALGGSLDLVARFPGLHVRIKLG